jgi:hypothetical protein
MASFLDLADVTDSDGVNAADYRLEFSGHGLLNQDSWIWGMIAKGLYLIFQWLTIAANTLLRLVFDSGTWLSAIGDLYQRIFAPLYAVFPPWAIAALGIGVVGFSAVSKNIKEKDFGTSTAKRMASALAMTAVTIVLAYNPAAMLAKLLEVANAFSVAVATAVTGGDPDAVLTLGQPMVDATLRSPTIALNYGRDMSAKCQGLWSEAMRAGTQLQLDTGCFTRGDDVAGPGHIATAVGVLLLAVPMLAFSGIAIWHYMKHMLLAALFLAGSAWAAALGVFQRRGFDTVSKVFAAALAHLVVAVVVSMMTVGLPAAFSGLGMNIFGALGDSDTRVFGQILGLAVGFAVSAWAIKRVADKHGLLVTALGADVTDNLTFLIGHEAGKVGFSNTRKINVLSNGGDKAGKGKGALAEDPKESTKPGRRRASGTKLVDDPDDTSPDDSTAAEQLASSTVADSTASGAGTPVLADATAGVVEFVVPAAAPSDPVVVPDDRFGEVEPAPELELDPVPAPTAAAGYSSPLGPPYGDREGSPADAGATPDGTTVTPDGTVSAGDGAAVAHGEAGDRFLADGAQLSRAAGPTSPEVSDPAEGGLTPVAGNLFADPDLDAAARRAGVSFGAGSPPAPTRKAPGFLRRYMPGRWFEADADGVAEVQYGDTLDTAGRSPLRDRLSDGVNRLRRSTTPEGSFSAIETPESSVQDHPHGFIAPQQDELASHQLMADLQRARDVTGASGLDLSVQTDPHDERLQLRLVADPEVRIAPPGMNFKDL